MDHPLIGRPVIDGIKFVARQHIDFIQDIFQLRDFSHIGEELLEIFKQPSGALSNLLLKPADTPKILEDLPSVIPGGFQTLDSVAEENWVVIRCCIYFLWQCC
jgi:hypothetical protein